MRYILGKNIKYIQYLLILKDKFQNKHTLNKLREKREKIL
jgi:hypothetical protein